MSADTGPTFVLEMDAAPRLLSVARRFVSAVAGAAGCPDDLIEDLKLAVSETLAVAADVQPSVAVTVVMRWLPERLDVEVRLPARAIEALSGDGGDLRSAIIRALLPDVVVDPGRSTVSWSVRRGASAG